MSNTISGLLIHDTMAGCGLEFRTVEANVSAIAGAIGCTYFDAVIGDDWAMYFDEDQYQGKLNRFAIAMVNALTGQPLSIKGNALMVGLTGSTEIDVPDRVIDLTLAKIPIPQDLRVTVLRHRKHVFVYDDQAEAIKALLSMVARHREARDLDPIEAYFGVPTTRWVELRVEIMDDWSIQLHDHRNDRSYG